MDSISKFFEITISSVGGLGDGIAEYNGKPVFVPKSVSGDRLRVQKTQETKEFIRAEIIEVLQAGEQRKSAPCPHFSACGGCSLQQMEDGYYREFKTLIAQNAFFHAGFEFSGKIEFLPASSRRRAEFRLIKESDKCQLAYLGNRSHSKTAIKNCLILEPKLQTLLAPLAELISDLPFVEDIELVNLTNADSGVEVTLTLYPSAKIPKDTKAIGQKLNFIAQELKLTRILASDSRNTPFAMVENGYLSMRLGSIDINLPTDAFLQATKRGQEILTNFVLENTENKKRVLDMFCGIGTYSVALAENAAVHAVDDHQIMIANLRHAARSHNMRLTTEQRNLFTKPFTAQELNGFDAIVINPPRSGAKAQVEEIAKSEIKNIVMISCNPASFARDAKILKNLGFALQSSLAIDQFVYSAHLELAASFTR